MHSPLPWKVRPQHIKNNVLSLDSGEMFCDWDIVCPENERSIARIGYYSGDIEWQDVDRIEVAKANRDFILTACNSYYKLTVMVDVLTKFLEEAHDANIFAENDDHEDDCSYCGAIREAKKLLEECESY